MGLPGNEDNLTIWAASTQYQRVTDRQTYVQPIAITCAVWLSDWRTLKTLIPAGRDYIPGPQLLILLYCVDAIFVLPVDPAWGLRPCPPPLTNTVPLPPPERGTRLNTGLNRSIVSRKAYCLQTAFKSNYNVLRDVLPQVRDVEKKTSPWDRDVRNRYYTCLEFCHVLRRTVHCGHWTNDYRSIVQVFFTQSSLS